MHHWLTFSRPCLAVAFCVGVGFASQQGRLTTTIMIVLLLIGVAAELTDLFDGMVARWAGAASELGGLFDPLADSLSRLAIYFSLAMAGWVAMAVPLVMTARDISVAYSRIVLARTGGKTSARLAGKVKAGVQAVGFLALVVLAWLADHGRANFALWGRWVVGTIVIVVTVWSAVEYVRAAVRGIECLRKLQTAKKESERHEAKG